MPISMQSRGSFSVLACNCFLCSAFVTRHTLDPKMCKSFMLNSKFPSYHLASGMSSIIRLYLRLDTQTAYKNAKHHSSSGRPAPIRNTRVMRLIGQWLEAGVMENGTYAETVEGMPQGAGISPLLANVFLHYALDPWVWQWQRRQATGRSTRLASGPR